MPVFSAANTVPLLCVSEEEQQTGSGNMWDSAVSRRVLLLPRIENGLLCVCGGEGGGRVGGVVCIYVCF